MRGGKVILNEAEKLAKEKHKGQKDLSGEDYINHVKTVVSIVEGMVGDYVNKEEYIQAARLHDILEDTDIIKEELMVKGFNKGVVNAVEQVTNNKKVTYEEYIESIESDVARVVKMADLTHNMDIRRLGKGNYEELTKGQKRRVDKYREAIKELSKSGDEIKGINRVYEEIKGGYVNG